MMMVNTKSWTFLVLTWIVLIHSEELDYRLVIHNSDPMARCLDGTSPALYLHEGGDDKKFVVFFVGGGYCQGQTISEVLEQCYQRSTTERGTSAGLPITMKSRGGYLSTDPSISKFASWTKLIIYYCDGAMHQGFTIEPIKYKEKELYFRGSANSRSHFKWLMNTYDFVNAEKVLLTGASAGGFGAFYWSNHVKSLLKNPKALYTVPDSAIFMNVTDPLTKTYKTSEEMRVLFQISNRDEKSPISLCNRNNQGQEYKCTFIQNSFLYLSGKFLFINSQYDAVAIQKLGIKCLKVGKSGATLSGCNTTEMEIIENYRKVYMKFVATYVQFAENNIWTIACSTHSYACYDTMYNVEEQRVPMMTGQTVKDAIDRFVFGNERVQSIDKVSWPDNSPCAY